VFMVGFPLGTMQFPQLVYLPIKGRRHLEITTISGPSARRSEGRQRRRDSVEQR
jgi:hypothetical protein